jgi:osmoprotectant transport system permease protein
MVRNPVLVVLALVGIVAALGLAFVAHAPNRIVSGQPIALAEAAQGVGLLVLAPAVLIVVGAFLPQGRAAHIAVLVAGAAFSVGLLWLAGAVATRLANPDVPSARTSLGAGFWVLAAIGWLAASDAARRLGGGPWPRLALGLATIGGVALLAAAGLLDELSLAKELATRSDVFLPAVARHVEIVGLALAPTLLVALPLGFWAFRRPRLRDPLFAALNVVQTIPSIALFGLLMVPLSRLAEVVPALAAHGVSGVGLAPAVIAITLYSLLPMARATTAGLAQVPAPVVEAARGIGFAPGQIFRSVELPLALPVILSGLRVTLVQAVGLAAVAALIGAGGLGAIMFQGLFSSALDLVLLGVIPIVLLAVVADATLSAAVAVAGRTP